MRFSDLSPHPALLEALEHRGYAEPTPVQALTLAPEHRGRDLLVSARTGSGKTVAFGLSFADQILGEARLFERAQAPLALIIAPTRELALQVQRELGWLYAPAGGRVRACVGGMDVRGELRALADGAHLVVGTPGRLCDHLDRGSLDLSAVRVVVLDEADEMLDMGFRDELERILRDAPPERRTLMFSATIPKGIAELAARYQRGAARVAATSPEEAHADIEYRAHLVAPREREHAVVNTLRMLEPGAALVFCATREEVNHLHANLVERGFEAVAISGELTQPERLRALTALRDGRARVLVATDVAARGLDLPALDLVIHADLPRDAQVLQHRSGRTGRAGRKGISVLLVPPRLRGAAERMLRTAKVEPRWSAVASVEDIKSLDQERLARDVAALCEEATEEDLAVARSLLAGREAERLVGALVRQRRTRLPEPEELLETARMKDELRQRGKQRPARFEGPRQVSGYGSRRFDEPRGPGERRPMAGAPAARPPERHPGERRPARGPMDGVWFRMNVGRLANADPRWLLPIICRRGGVTKAEIGTIQILPKETRFLVAREASRQFAAAVAKPDRKDPSIRIEPVGGERPYRGKRQG